MNNSTLNIKNDSFTKKGFVLFIATGIVGVCNFGYHIFMIRNLSLSDYGILNSLIALLMFATQPSATIYMASTKFSSQYFSLEQPDKTKHFIMHLGKRLLVFASTLLVLTLLFYQSIADFMQIENKTLVMLSGFIGFFALMLPIFYGMLSGYQRFGKVGFALSFESILRFSLGAVAVITGLGLTGILSLWNVGLILSLLLLVSFSHKVITGNYMFGLKEIFVSNKKEDKVESEEFKKIYKYLGIIAVFSFLLVGVISVNVLLVKHFFSPQKAGYFSIAQMVGKIVLFLPFAFSVVMFSRSSAGIIKGNHEQNRNDLKKAFLLTALFSGIAAFIIILFPSYIIKMVSGQFYAECLPLVKLFALAMWFFSISLVMFNYNLAVERYKSIFFLLIFLVLEIGLIILFHEELIQVLWILNTIAFLIVVSLGVYTFK